MARKQASKRRNLKVYIGYPAVIFILLCAGIYLVAWTLGAHADQTIKAVIHAQPVTQPATIDPAIANGTHYNQIPIEVNGTCPQNAAYIEIFDNGVMGGSAICDNGFYDPTLNLFPGLNVLEAHSFNSTDDEGPVSAPVSVYYDPPAAPATEPLLLQTAFIYKGYDVGQTVSWPISVSGGSAPYAISVDWGDGHNDLISRGQAGEFDINHTYGQAGVKTHNSYNIVVKATDAAGQAAYIQFFLIVNPQNSASGITQKAAPDCVNANATNIACGFQHIAKHSSWLWAAWPFYLVVVLMVVSYRLGEREELLILTKKGRLNRRRA